MQELEKIIKEIEEATRQEDAPIYCGSMEVDGYVRMSVVKDIICNHMNDGWIPVERELPPNAKHKGDFCPRVRVMTKFGETYGWYNPDCESWYVLVWFMTERYLDSEIDFDRGDNPKIVRLPDEVNKTKHILIAWQPLPESYRPEGKEEWHGETNN